jgi:serine/threonine protein kinase
MKEALDTQRLEPAFAISERFEIRRQLGRGGMGIVYLAYDRERRTDVALKVLPKRDPESMYRLKQEFRALTDVVHPSLVVLHELIATNDQWFFTMEHIDGVDLVEWVCGPAVTARGMAEQSGETRRDPLGRAASLERAYTVTLQNGEAPAKSFEPREPRTEQSPALTPESSIPPPPRGGTRADIGRLRAALAQLTAGISAIHEARKLHLDLKPANVMVQEDGRVVVLDFGLAQDMPLDLEGAPGDVEVRGTPAYMAPEQARGERLTPAADWYAVGAILFRILTGQLLPPKPYRELKAPSEFVEGVPEDLDELCAALLRLDPGARAGAVDVLRCVPVTSALDAAVSPPTPTAGRKAPFVGRAAHLAALHDAFAATRGGQPVVVYLGGQSGMGKTALATELIDDLRLTGAALVLSGRCYERESVPFKALDSVIDALADYLKRLPRAAAAGLLPRGIHELGRIFPALRQVEAISDVPQRTFDISDDGERRRRAFAALKELLSRLVDTGPLVVFIDDLQWGDVDSARLLSEVLGPPDPPALLLVGTYRTEEEPWSPALSELLRLDVRDVRRLEVLGLTVPEARDLARALLGGTEPDAEQRAATVAAESEGSPLFVLELARHVSTPLAAMGTASSLSLEQALLGRFERLGADALRLLEVVAVAGGPLEQGVASGAAELTSDP